MNMEIEMIAPGLLIPYERNPKKHPVKQIEMIKKSFELFGWTNPILVAENNMVVAGHARLTAANELGLVSVPIIRLDMSYDKAVAYVIADNRLADIAEEDGEELAALLQEIQNAGDIDLEAIGYTDDEIDELLAGSDSFSGSVMEAKTSLLDRFLVPPFSILDTRQGYWQDRKRQWNILIGDTGETREDVLGFESIAGKGTKYSGHEKTKTVSILDAVLAELVNLWFNVPGGKNLDCFAGDTVFGFVSGYTGHEFTGIELRPEQAAYNQERADMFSLPCKYINDDGQNVLKHVQKKSVDLLFSCPPYYDLEVYSSLPNDASNQETYEQFLEIITKAFTDSFACLKENRFAVVVCSDIRDKNGVYRRFPDDIKSRFVAAGACLYNELIIVNPAGTAPIRASNAMKNRKVVKVHQNVLIFYNGNPNNIRDHFPELDFKYVYNLEEFNEV